MDYILSIQFGKSRSTKFKRVVSIAKCLPGYSEANGIYSLRISTMKDCLVNKEVLNEIIEIIRSWKSSEIWLYGSPYTSEVDMSTFTDALENHAGKYASMLKNREVVSLGAITIEPLPLPFVFYPPLYGSFFTFADDIDGQQYFCECERKALTNYIQLKQMGTAEQFKLDLSKDFPNGINQKHPEEFMFKEGLCFRCNKKVPKKTYCHPMYGGQFKQHYGWYINQEYYKLGIERALWGHINVLPEICTPELYDTVQRINQLVDRQQDWTEHYKEIAQLKKALSQAIENTVREQFGVKKIGDAWVSETILYNIVKDLYPQEKIVRHYRPDWLDGLELDIFLPDMKLGLEYQGIQHFIAVSHWGGEAQLQKQKEHDQRKKKLCTESDIRLICIDYNEPLDSEHIQLRIQGS